MTSGKIVLYATRALVILIFIVIIVLPFTG